jgi:hypothetical protein
MFATLFSQLDEAMKQLSRQGTWSSTTLRSSGTSRISVFSSSGSTPPVVTVAADGTLTVSSGG